MLQKASPHVNGCSPAADFINPGVAAHADTSDEVGQYYVAPSDTEKLSGIALMLSVLSPIFKLERFTLDKPNADIACARHAANSDRCESSGMVLRSVLIMDCKTMSRGCGAAVMNSQRLHDCSGPQTSLLGGRSVLVSRVGQASRPERSAPL